MSSNPCNYMDYGGGDHKRQSRAARGRSSLAKVCGRRLNLRPYRLFARSVCDVQHRCSCSFRKCYTFTFFTN